jgi:hypothetical protein
MRKIKSVKLKNDYNNSIVCFQRGTPLYRGVELWKTTTADLSDLLFTDSEILNNKTDLFEIEYEEEIKYIDVRIEFENEDYTDSWKPAMIRYIERTLNNNFIMTKNFKVTELESKSKEYEEIIDERKNL